MSEAYYETVYETEAPSEEELREARQRLNDLVPPSDTDRLDWTVARTAKLFGCTPRHVRDLIAAGRLRAYRLSPHGPLRLRKSDIDIALDTGRV
jgi:excisionase family DNA binding protein